MIEIIQIIQDVKTMDISFWGLIIFTSFLSFALSWLGASIGLILGHLRLPLLIYILDSPILGALSNLIISGFGALGGSIQHYKNKRISSRVLLLIGVPSIIGAILGVWIFIHIPKFWGYLIISIMFIYSGINLIVGDKEGRSQYHFSKAFLIISQILMGLVLGMLSTVSGLMLGSLRLPLMIKMFNIDTKVAIGSNLVIGCMTAFAGAICSWILIPEKNLLTFYSTLFIIPPTLLGGYLGAKMTDRFSADKLTFIIGIAVVLMGVFFIAQAFWHL
jgi:uncharacterized membrane protein YfcA